MRSRIAAVFTTWLAGAAALAAPPQLLEDFGTTLRTPGASVQLIPWTAGSFATSGQALVAVGGGYWLTDGRADGAGTRTVNGIGGGAPLVTYTMSAARVQTGAMTLTFRNPTAGNFVYGIDPATLNAQVLLDGGGVTEPGPVGDRFVFASDDGVHGVELWSTDGTRPGTAILADLSPGAADTSLSIIATNGTQAWLSVKTAGDSTRRVWITDGTAPGTRALGPISPTSPDADVLSAAVVRNGIVYAARDAGDTITRLYFANTTSGPTTAIGAPSGPITVDAATLVSTGRHAIFTAADAGNIRHLFSTGGVAAAPLSETLLTFNNEVGIVEDSTAPFGWLAYFPGGSSSTGTEPCRTDGTRAGTYRITDLNPGADGSRPEHFVALDGSVYFEPSTYNINWLQFVGSLFVTDGTPDAITNLTATVPGAPSRIQGIAPGDGTLLCAVVSGSAPGLWTLDPTPSTFSRLGSIPAEAPASSSWPRVVMTDRGRALLSAFERYPYAFVTDGTAEGTRRVTASDPQVGPNIAFTNAPCQTAIGGFGQGLAAFLDSDYGAEPWVIDPASASAQLLRDIRPGSVTSGSVLSDRVPARVCTGSFSGVVIRRTPDELAVFAAKPLAPAGVSSYAVWATDGTPGGTIELSRHQTVSAPVPLMFNFTPLSGRAFFFAPARDTEPATLSVDLWVTDGTAAGTQRVAALDTSGMDFPWAPTQLVAANGRVYFTGPVGGVSRLFASDGAAANTGPADLGPELADFDIGRLVPTDEGMVFVATGPDRRPRLWITDGTAGPPGTRPLTPDTSDARYADIDQFLVSGPRVYFSMWTREYGRELWKFDSASESAQLVADAFPGPASSFPRVMCALDGGGAVFAAFTPGRGLEPWHTDGTGGGFGARPIADINPGPGSSVPTPGLAAIPVDRFATIRLDTAAQLGSSLIFAASDGTETGEELWQWTVVPPCRCDADNNGHTQIDDVFAFLSLYFSGRGDFNADGATGVQDIFDFLECWFAGCA